MNEDREMETRTIPWKKKEIETRAKSLEHISWTFRWFTISGGEVTTLKPAGKTKFYCQYLKLEHMCALFSFDRRRMEPISPVFHPSNPFILFRLIEMGFLSRDGFIFGFVRFFFKNRSQPFFSTTAEPIKRGFFPPLFPGRYDPGRK